jgi:hypothetical protein
MDASGATPREREHTVDTLSELYQKRVDRRKFMLGATATAGATALAGCNPSPVPTQTAPTSTGFTTFSDKDLLNLALNLEYLEAEFYLYAATGTGLAAADTTGTGTLGTTTFKDSTGATFARQLTGLSAAQQNIVNEIAHDELAHVQFLRKALGSSAVARPAIDLTFFAPLAVAAKIPGATATGSGAFNPYSSFDAFLLGAFIFEDVGVTAYAGAAPLITPAGVTAGLLAAAAGILAVEAYHAGYVRAIITGNSATNAGATFATVPNANLISALRSTLGGGMETPLTTPNANIASIGGVTSPVYSSSIVAASTASAIGFSRTPDQVHHIVYGSPTVGVSKGGFFPNGTNSVFFATLT